MMSFKQFCAAQRRTAEDQTLINQQDDAYHRDTSASQTQKRSTPSGPDTDARLHHIEQTMISVLEHLIRVRDSNHPEKRRDNVQTASEDQRSS